MVQQFQCLSDFCALLMAAVSDALTAVFTINVDSESFHNCSFNSIFLIIDFAFAFLSRPFPSSSLFSVQFALIFFPPRPGAKGKPNDKLNCIGGKSSSVPGSWKLPVPKYSPEGLFCSLSRLGPASTRHNFGFPGAAEAYRKGSRFVERF